MTHKLSDDRLDELQEEVADHDNGWVAPSEFISILSELRTARRAAKKAKEGLEYVAKFRGHHYAPLWAAGEQCFDILADKDVKEFTNLNKETGND